MTILIDGYNLLHAGGLLGRRQGPGGLERARGALLGFLAASLTPEEAARTIVVFDAGVDAPRDRPRHETLHGIQVRYSEPGQEADDLLEQLIAADSAPKQLLVVSGDHRLQRAARRRKATPASSESWFDELKRRRRLAPQGEATSGTVTPTAKPTEPLAAEEVERWLREFGFDAGADGANRP